jgi:AraC-like DNA-binding protein
MNAAALDYRHRSVTLLNVPAYLAARSVDPVEFLRRVNVPAAFFSDINAFIPRELCFALEDSLLKLTGDRMLGGNVANRYHLSELGPWGNAILAASTLRDALSFAISQIHLLQTGFTLAQFRDGDSLVVAFHFQGRSAYYPAQHILGSAVVVRKIALLAGVPEAVEVLMQRPYSPELSDADELLGSHIRFNAPWDGVRIDLGVMENPIAGKQQDIRPSVQTAWDVTSHIRKYLPYRRVTKEYVASLIGTSPRTVQRRLSEWGLSYEQLLDDVRRNEALRLVEESRLSIADIAAFVGYSDGPHFMRAFRRWTGMTPVTFRRLLQQRPN